MTAEIKIIQTGESLSGMIIVEEKGGGMVMTDKVKRTGLILETTGTIRIMRTTIEVTDFSETKTTTNKDKMTTHRKVSP